MNRMSRHSAERLGYELYDMGFRPVPDIDDEGRLHGVRMFRNRSGLLEYITLRPSGLATAGRVVAEFDYRRPFDHGAVLETRRGYVLNVLRWLLSDMDLHTTQPIPASVPEEVADTGRHRLTDTARHRLMAASTPEPEAEGDTRPRPSPHPRLRPREA